MKNNIPWLSVRHLKSVNNTKRKEVNVAFILLNCNKMTYKEMAEELGVSLSKVRSVILEYHIPYKKKKPNQK